MFSFEAAAPRLRKPGMGMPFLQNCASLRSGSWEAGVSAGQALDEAAAKDDFCVTPAVREVDRASVLSPVSLDG
jgi:hypothetical protein